MEKILLEYQKQNHLAVLKQVESDLKLYNQLYSFILSSSTEVAASLDNMQQLVKDPEGFIFDLIVDKKSLNFNGLPICKKKAIEMIEFPANYVALISEVKHFNQARTGAYKYRSSGIEETISAISFGDLSVKDHKVIASDKFMEGIKSEFCVYTRNDNQAKAVQSINSIIDHILILKKLGISKEYDLTLGAIGINVDGEHPKIDTGKVLRI